MGAATATVATSTGGVMMVPVSSGLYHHHHHHHHHPQAVIAPESRRMVSPVQVMPGSVVGAGGSCVLPVPPALDHVPPQHFSPLPSPQAMASPVQLAYTPMRPGFASPVMYVTPGPDPPHAHAHAPSAYSSKRFKASPGDAAYAPGGSLLHPGASYGGVGVSTPTPTKYAAADAAPSRHRKVHRTKQAAAAAAAASARRGRKRGPWKQHADYSKPYQNKMGSRRSTRRSLLAKQGARGAGVGATDDEDDSDAAAAAEPAPEPEAAPAAAPRQTPGNGQAKAKASAKRPASAAASPSTASAVVAAAAKDAVACAAVGEPVQQDDRLASPASVRVAGVRGTPASTNVLRDPAGVCKDDEFEYVVVYKDGSTAVVPETMAPRLEGKFRVDVHDDAADAGGRGFTPKHGTGGDADARNKEREEEEEEEEEEEDDGAEMVEVLVE